MHKLGFLFGISLLSALFIGTVLCQETVSTTTRPNPDNPRQFHMGFSTWPYASRAEAVDDTYHFIGQNADIYLEQIDDKVPWQEAIADEPFPEAFVKEMTAKRDRRPPNLKLLLGLTPLNGGRSGLADAYGGKVPDELANKPFDDATLINAYIDYCRWMINLFQPNYLIVGIETNELLNNSPDMWLGYTHMSKTVHQTLKAEYPDLMISESVTLHKLINPEVPDPDAYREQIKDFIADFDFAAVSFYPFFVGYHTREDFSKGFDLLKQWTDKPIGITETAHPADPMVLERWNFRFDTSPSEQNDYIEILLERAQTDKWLFTIIFSGRDYDELWQTFPDAVKDLGRLWRDTGLLDENGVERQAMATWRNWLGSTGP